MKIRKVGTLWRGAVCANCGATCPNTWSDPMSYVTISDCDGLAADKVYCSTMCERETKSKAVQVAR